MQSKKVFQYKIPIIVACSVIIGMLIGMRIQRNMSHKGQNSRDKINELIARLKQYYVDDINIDSVANKVLANNNKLIDSLESNQFKQILAALDPHSVYIPPALVKQENDDMRGSFAGVGIEYAIIRDTVCAVHVVPNGPAAKAGVEVGDKIVAIADSIVTGKQNDATRLRRLFRGEVNSKVKLQIMRGGQTTTKTVTRGMVDLPSIDAYFMMNATVGYIKLSKFSLTSHTEFKEALIALKKQGMSALVFDLRGNGGGIMTDAVKIVDEFIAGKTLVTYTQGAKDKKQEYYTGTDGNFETGQLAILIDENSASAAEVVAGSLQDLDRATIIGRRSFGKGLVQRQFGFVDKSAVRITVARYYIPSGRCIQKPYNQGKNDYEQDIEKRYKNNELFYADSIKLDKSIQYKTKKGRIVYGGGGIMPDVFIPLDTITFNTKNIAKIEHSSSYFQFANEYFIDNITKLTAYKDAKNFNEQFQVDDACWKQFLAYLSKSGSTTNFSPQEIKYLKSALKKNIARVTFRLSGYYQVSANDDMVIQKSLQLLK